MFVITLLLYVSIVSFSTVGAVRLCEAELVVVLGIRSMVVVVAVGGARVDGLVCWSQGNGLWRSASPDPLSHKKY